MSSDPNLSTVVLIPSGHIFQAFSLKEGMLTSPEHPKLSPRNSFRTIDYLPGLEGCYIFFSETIRDKGTESHFI